MYRPGGHTGLVHAGGRNNAGPAAPYLHHRFSQGTWNGQPFPGGKGKHPAPPPAPDQSAGFATPLPVGGNKGKQGQQQNKRKNGQIKGLYRLSRAARRVPHIPHIIFSHEKTKKYTAPRNRRNLQVPSVFFLLLKECVNSILNQLGSFLSRPLPAFLLPVTAFLCQSGGEPSMLMGAPLDTDNGSNLGHFLFQIVFNPHFKGHLGHGAAAAGAGKFYRYGAVVRDRYKFHIPAISLEGGPYIIKSGLNLFFKHDKLLFP
jgi:hypothetical protein